MELEIGNRILVNIGKNQYETMVVDVDNDTATAWSITTNNRGRVRTFKLNRYYYSSDGISGINDDNVPCEVRYKLLD